MAGNGYAKSVLVTTGWLAERLGDEALAVVEVDECPNLYDEGHIPGAARLRWREDLQDPLERDLVDRRGFERLLGERGIANDTLVVLYGDRDNWFAAFAYWYLKVYGHAEARLLDGGRQKWIEEGRPLTREAPAPEPRLYLAKERDNSIRAFRSQVIESLGARGRALVDVRTPAEYAGEIVAPPGYEHEGAQRAGHIPTAISIPWACALRDDGTFRPAEELRALYVSHGVTPEKEVTAYCRIGERSSLTWFVLRELLGYERVRNYDGSWTEWGNLVDAPIER
jgi:thiosulfate/3-mercaptopyruvate sulfurtransferase